MQSGVNFRSLQDYEQGHKSLSSTNEDVLLRLSTVLGCSTEDLLPDHLKGATIHEHNQMPDAVIQAQRLYCEKYHIAGRSICRNGTLSTLFYDNGLPYYIPFHAYFTGKLLPNLKEAAAPGKFGAAAFPFTLQYGYFPRIIVSSE